MCPPSCYSSFPRGCPVGVVATIGVRAYINFDPVKRDKGRLADTLDVFQMITLISSLITNTLGTGIISLKAWYALVYFLAPTRRFLSWGTTGRRYRRWIVADIQRIVDKRTKAERVLALLVESGVLYIFSGVRPDLFSPRKVTNILIPSSDLGDACRISAHPSTWIPLRTREFILAGSCPPSSKY